MTFVDAFALAFYILRKVLIVIFCAIRLEWLMICVPSPFFIIT